MRLITIIFSSVIHELHIADFADLLIRLLSSAMPGHFAESPCYGNLLADPQLWTLLRLMQHDEKDLFAVKGERGIQDLGDGAAQSDKAELHRLEHAPINTSIAGLRGCDGGAPCPIQSELRQALALLQSMLLAVHTAAVDANAHARKRQAAVDAKAAKEEGEELSAAAEKLRSFLTEHNKDVNETCGRIERLVTQSKTLDRQMATAMAAPAAAVSLAPLHPAPLPPAREVLSLLNDMTNTYRHAWDLAHVPATKVLLVCTCSPLAASEWGVGHFFFTHDTTTTAQTREMLLRAMASQYRESHTIPIGLCADKAYIGMGHWDLEGHPKTRSAFLKVGRLFHRLLRAAGDGETGTAKVKPRDVSQLTHLP